MAERPREPTLRADPADGAAPSAAEPPPWARETRGGRLWWLLLVLLILAGLGWYLWDKGHLEALLGGPAPAPAAAGLAPAEALELETLLAALALEPGPVDGALDAATARAIGEFQAMAGLPADGQATSALLEELRAVARQMGLQVKPGG